MTENNTVTVEDNMATEEKPEPKTFEKGTWQATLDRSARLFDKSATEKKRAGVLLWQGAQAAIEDWLPTSKDDVSAERLYTEVQDILGKPRRGDASKVKTVAIAVKNHGLLPSLYPNLSKAYAEARRLTATVQQERAEDEAAEKTIESLDAPKTASTAESAALIVLSKGLDEAARLLLDALGPDNNAVHRAFMRSVSQEVAGRVKPKTQPKPKAGPKEGATEAKSGGTKAKPAVKTAEVKAKPVATKAKPVTKAKPAEVKAKPVVKGRPVVKRSA